MKTKHMGLAVVAAVVCGFTAQAQQTSMSLSTLNATGGSAEIANGIYEYSIGEMTLVHTVSTPNLIVTQGVLQPLEGSVGIAATPLADNALMVYPNPSESIVYIQPNLEGQGKLTLVLLDITGRQLYKQVTEIQSGNEKQSINLGSFAQGSYMLQATFSKNNQDFSKNFKIQKIN